MAEIRIEQNRRGLGWVWLMPALIIVAAMARDFLYPGRTTTTPATGAPATSGARGRDVLQVVEAPRGASARLVVTSYTGGRYGEEG